MEVRVVRSARRRRTVEAKLLAGVLEVRIPAHASRDDEEHYVAHFREHFERKRRAAQLDLEGRARRLAGRYGLPVPRSIRWVDNQRRRWGSCSIESRDVRLSSVLVDFPSWVVDYVIVHELAHLVEPGHTRAFHALVARYPKAERAEGFLLAKGMDEAGALEPEPLALDVEDEDSPDDEAPGDVPAQWSAVTSRGSGGPPRTTVQSTLF